MTTSTPEISSSPRGRVITWITQAIETGKLARGAPVPAERVLAQQLNVSRVTVKAALADLVRMGLVQHPEDKRQRRVAMGAGVGQQAMLGRTVALLSTIPNVGRAVPNFDTALQIQIMRSLSEAGLNPLIIDPLRNDAHAEEDLIASRIGGVILAYRVAESPKGQALARRCRDAGIPVVLYGDDPTLADFDRVTHDHEAGARELTNLLIQRGCRRILCFWRFLDDHAWLRQRYAGYEQALRQAGLPVQPAARCPDIDQFGSFPNRVRAFAGFLSEHVLGPAPIDGLMLATDLHALEAGSALRLLGKNPGTDVKIVGYDNAWQHWRSSSPDMADAPPPLATVDKQQEEIAAHLVRLLLDRREGSKLPREPQRRAVAPLVLENKFNV